LIHQRDLLEVVIARSTAADSLYWSFRDLEGADPEIEQLVEARLNMSPEKLATFSPPPSWTVQETDPDGIVYMRRWQALTDDAVKGMITEMISMAYACDGQFWSWLHGSALDH
jgi:hypothetical protein